MDGPFEDCCSAGACSTNEHFITKVCSLDEERKLVQVAHLFFIAFHWDLDCGFWYLVFQVAWPRRTWPNLRYYYAKWPAEATPELSYPLPLWSGLHLCDFKSSWECDSTPYAGAEAEVSGGCLRPVCTRDTAVTQSPAARIFAQRNRDQSAL